MAAMNNLGKAEGDISDTFTSLSGKKTPPLPDRFRELKLRLVSGHEDAVIASWKRLLAALQNENELIARTGPAIIPEVRFSHLQDDLEALKPEIKKRGVAVIRGVIPEDEARSYKFEIEEYVRQNPHTRGFPPSEPQVLEVYWSPAQVRARAHPNLLATQRALMTTLWHAASDPSAPVSMHTPLSYADRLRIRRPGDAHFALGPHQDGGSVERWEERGYGRGGVYDAVFRGRWDGGNSKKAGEGGAGYDPFDAAPRVRAVTDLYGGLGACSMFRMFQGWLAISRSGPLQGTLLVNPLVKETGVYALLRPFFAAKRGLEELDGNRERYLDEDNWEFTGGERMTSEIQGAAMGCAQEFPEGAHPHLELEKTMVHVPEVRPGDYVVWHCDTIHAVDKKHAGTSDSSVLYIPVCPTTVASAEYVARQRAAFLRGTPAPDFPGGEGESRHIGRATEEYVKKYCDPLGVQSIGLDRLATVEDDTPGGKAAVEEANRVLGF
ncbi:hypothetical protein MYCTH_2308330 [Thermothelomyces thermophilus ATCC 42464]|uniref:DUF1479-domain-containing protein n=1 Tax=Thermothelomyces thermophilus (strain ATCC 42464 / BCRC 31852 / DSM 1799) TaxID=573729 RepID=G2QJN7_THET4|nr:uncharacterized protein MYCTH_2308330 [Thermothelomyces thermophilus ATCC 42464]AEO59794.1 hypothetical protein MYCTH_2308330 [Thermothelomyces thermophilus ATCC 42464]